MGSSLRTTTLLLGLIVALAGCEPDAPARRTGCASPCPAGQICVAEHGFCIPDPSLAGPGPTQPGPSTPPPTPGAPGAGSCAAPLQWCGGRCVDFQSDPLNCGGCGVACGANAQCALGRCQCAGVFNDCNGTFADGCECQGACNGAQCGSGSAAPSGCDPTQAHACGSAGALCDATTRQCAACPVGYSNCDGQWACECQGSCNGSQCASVGGGGGGGGQPQQPSCSPTQYNACGDHRWYCDPAARTCQQCSNGLFGWGAKSNCDGVGGCETSGTSCTSTSTPQCDPTAYNPCGDRYWTCDASTRTCQRCSAGALNCDLRAGCEVFGSSCAPTGGGGGGGGSGYVCSETAAWTCGGDTRYCDRSSGSCMTCAWGRYNCNGTYGCESTIPCGSTGGGGGGGSGGSGGGGSGGSGGGGTGTGSAGASIGSMWITYYYLANENDYSGSKSTTLYDSSCNPIATVSAAYSDAVCIEGSGKLSNGTVINYARTCSCGRRCPTGGTVCYKTLGASKPWGEGAFSNALEPLRSIAVDKNIISLKRVVYIKQWDGVSIPRVDGIGGFVHDGCFRADDVGGAIKGNHYDFFSGTQAMYRALDKIFKTKTSFSVYDGGTRCAYLANP